MQIKSLEYFLKAADLQSASKAAEQLYLSQQGLSKSISSLEKELGVRLFTRGAGGIELTPAGSVTAKHSSKILREYQSMQNDLRRLFRSNSQYSEVLDSPQLLATPYIANCLLPILQKTVGRTFVSDYEIEKIEQEQLPTFLLDQSAYESRVALVALPSNAYADIIDSTLMQFMPLFTTNVALLCPKDLALPGSGVLKLEELGEIPTACFNDSKQSVFINRCIAECEAHGNPMHFAMSLNEMMSLVSNGTRAVLLDTFSIHMLNRHPNCVVRTLRPTMTLNVGFFVGTKVLDYDSSYNCMLALRECLHKKYGSYLKDNRVPCPDYTPI